MAKALKCDRCGKLYEYYKPSSKRKESNGLRLVDFSLFTDNYTNRAKFDLCPSCMEQIVSFLYLETKEIKHDQN